MVLTKEYRIPLPISVEEYKIAQRFMVAKVSKEHTGNGEGIEILENKPYEDDNSKGQYTHKIIHIGSRIPGWLKSIMPSSALQVDEKAWNAFPYCKTVYSCPFLGDRFSISVETRYIGDNGSLENVFNLTPEQLKERQVDVIDIAYDPLDPAKYKKEEDPTIFESTKTGRGKLQKDWMKTVDPVMTCYKNCAVEFRYWGFQTKVEQYIHKLALRDVMQQGHRQAFCWVDDWFGMTMDDIIALEAKTAAELERLRKGEAVAESESGAEPGKEEVVEVGAVEVKNEGDEEEEELDGASPPSRQGEIRA